MAIRENPHALFLYADNSMIINNFELILDLVNVFQSASFLLIIKNSSLRNDLKF